MAKVLFTAIVADMRNKLNGTVFSKNRYGAYTRTKVTPVNPQTDAQQTVRGRFGARSAGWRGLTEAQRQSWIDAAPNFPVFDIFGNSKILSGSALYNRLNLNIEKTGGSAITTAPAAVAIPTQELLIVAADVSSSSVTVNNGIAGTGIVPAGYAIVLQLTPLYGPGIYFVKNKFRQAGSFPAATDLSAANVFANWTALFGPLVAGQKLSIRMEVVNVTTGQAGVPFSASCIVTA